jgi:hypothetical protein
MTGGAKPLVEKLKQVRRVGNVPKLHLLGSRAPSFTRLFAVHADAIAVVRYSDIYTQERTLERPLF